MKIKCLFGKHHLTEIEHTPLTPVAIYKCIHCGIKYRIWLNGIKEKLRKKD